MKDQLQAMKEKRIIEIGSREVSDMTEEEISELLYRFGYSASSQYWDAPTVSIYDREVKKGYTEVWFEYTCIRKDDGLKHEHKGWLRMGSGFTGKNDFCARLVIVKHKNDHDITGRDLPIQALAWLISKGFNVPIYTNQESYFPIFTDYKSY